MSKTGTVEGIEALIADMTAWRRDIHAHPETAFEEQRTSALVARLLTEFGCEVHTGLAKTGVVGVLRNGSGPAIALRADMDALDVHERTGLDYASTHPGKMHACGHDGHTAMLLGAAKHLSATRSFAGTVVFIFQPAEEGAGGARIMVEDGLFERFPVDGVYGLHNWPGMALGTFAVKAGPMMAGFDSFDATVTGHGAHGGMPHLGVDSIVVAAEIVSAWQTIASRMLNPMAQVVLSVTQIHGGDAYNVIPETVVLKGALRTFDPAVRDQAWSRMQTLGQGIAQAHGASFALELQETYPPTLNSATEAEYAARAAAQVAGVDDVQHEFAPSMGAEDFAYMLNACPGAYAWLGNGPGEGGCTLHNPAYDFNDQALVYGASYWVRLVESLLKP